MGTYSHADRSRWWALVAICLGTFMLLVDVTIVSVALPAMARGLHAQLASLQWVVDAYALTLAALLLVGGSLADRFGRRRLFTVGLFVFATASLACALAPNANLLIAARALQGGGGAAMFATNSALLNATYEGRDRGIAFGIWGAVNGAAAAVAPVLGGLLIQAFDWRAIFLVNLPVAALAIVMTSRVIEESHGYARRTDWPGAAAFTVSTACLTFALINGGNHGWGALATVSTFVIAAVSLVLFIALERRSSGPLLDLELMRERSFATLMLAAAVLSAGAFAAVIYTQLWLQSVLGMSAIKAGLVLAPLAAVAFLVSATVGRHMQRLEPRIPLGIGLVLIGLGALLRTMLTASSSWEALLPGLVVTGLGVGLSSAVLVAAALAAAPPERAGMAGGAVNTFRQLGYAFGIAVLGSVFSAKVTHTFSASGRFAHPARAAAQATQGQAHALIAQASVLQRSGVVHAIRDAYAGAQNEIYLLAGLTAIIGGLLVVAVVRPAVAVAALAPHDLATTTR